MSVFICRERFNGLGESFNCIREAPGHTLHTDKYNNQWGDDADPFNMRGRRPVLARKRPPVWRQTLSVSVLVLPWIYGIETLIGHLAELVARHVG